MNTKTSTQQSTTMPGVTWGRDMVSGEERPYYANEAPPPGVTPLPAPQVQQVAAQRDVVPARLLAGGASLSMVLGTAGAVAPQLEHVGHAIEMAGFGAGALLVGAALVRSGGVKVAVHLVNTVTGSTSSSSSTSSSTSSSRLWGQK